MLDTIVNTTSVPGSNLSGDLACADWRFLLPSLDLEEVLCLRTPPINAVATLATICRRVNVASTDVKALEELKHAAQERNLSELGLFHVENYARLPFSKASMDLIWMADSAGRSHPVGRPEVAAEVLRILRPEGTVYFETFGPMNRLLAVRAFCRLGRRLGVRQYWLTPQGGEIRTAIAAGDRAMALHFFRRVLFGRSFWTRALSRAGEALTGLGLVRLMAWRRGIVLDNSETRTSAAKPPKYLASLAKRGGVDLGSYRFGLSATGLYNSNKVIFYLWEKSREEPEIVVKMTRAGEFNSRLANEAAVLRSLRQKEFVEAGSYPELLLFDTYRGRAVMAQKAIPGEPFRRRTHLTSQCPFAQRAISWMVRLGKASANNPAGTASQVASKLDELLARFGTIYDSSEYESDFLKSQIDRIRSHRGAFPLVFQHGDTGTWNLLVRPDGRVAFIDWENGEPNGMPLWDLFYFLRAFGTWISRQNGNRDREASFQNNFLTPSPLRDLLATATEGYCEQLNLAAHLAEPLFYSCWVHWALREAARLPSARLQEGVYVRLLRLCIRERDRLSRVWPSVSEGCTRAAIHYGSARVKGEKQRSLPNVHEP